MDRNINTPLKADVSPLEKMAGQSTLLLSQAFEKSPTVKVTFKPDTTVAYSLLGMAKAGIIGLDQEVKMELTEIVTEQKNKWGLLTKTIKVTLLKTEEENTVIDEINDHVEKVEPVFKSEKASA